jgi:hypothetical protein
MHISGPERYKLNFDSTNFQVTCERGTPRFSGIATSKKPKLYIVSADDKPPFYVGVTKQSLRNRLRLGWKAKGESGYYGYAWRHCKADAFLDVWCQDDAPAHRQMLDIETLEAEVVFLIRCAGQWPLDQTEIHFHPSSSTHRETAVAVLARYALNLSSVPVRAGRGTLTGAR